MSKHRINTLIIIFSVFLAVFSSTTSVALESEEEAEWEWSADGDSKMRVANGTRIIEMSNNVKINQGSLKISGDEATIEYNIANNEVSKVIVTGSPVRYQQELNPADGMTKGSSKTITIYTDDSDGSEIVELVGEAVIESPNSNFQCSVIIYIAEQDLVREATGPCTGVFNSISQ